jgi:hypothetical protein
MARIPIQNGGSLPTAPQGARVPMSLNLPIGQTPIPQQGEQWAQAIGQAGGLVLQLQEKYAELNDTRNLIEAENVMRAKTQEFNTWRRDPANADESKWLPHWQEMQNETQKFVDGLKITDRARLGLTRSFGRWSDGQTISVQGDAFKQNVKRTGAALQLRAQQAEDDGNDGQVSSSYDEMAKLGVTTKEEAELAKYNSLQRSKATRVQQSKTQLDTLLNDPAAKFEDVRSFVEQNPDLTDSEKTNLLVKAENRYGINGLEHLIYENPDHGLEAVQNDFQRGTITANQLDALDKMARSRKTQIRGEEYSAITDAIKANSKPEQLVPMIDNSKQLTAGDKAEIMAALDRPANDPKVLSTLAKEAANFKYSPESPEYFLFTKRVDTLATGDSRSHILGLRDKALADDQNGSFARSRGKVFTFADDDLKNGVFGPITGKLSDSSSMLPIKIQAEVDEFRKYVSEKKGMMWNRQDKAPEEIEMEARKLWLVRENKGKQSPVKFEDFVLEDPSKERQAAILQVQAIQEYEAYQAAHPEKSSIELMQQYDLITAKVRAENKLPPIAPRGGVNPVGTTLPELNERANSILSR